MTGFLVTSEQTALLALYLNGGTKTNSPTLYLGLCTGVTQATGAITGEPSGNNYSRVSIAANGTTIFGSAASGQITNSAAAITFPTASGSWGTLTTWFLSTSVSGGTAIMFGTLDSSVTVSASQAPTFATTKLTLDASGW